MCMTTDWQVQVITATSILSSLSPDRVIKASEITNSCQYMIVFHYGSIVLFNVEDNKAELYLQIVKRYASSLLPEMTKDDYTIKEKPLMEKDMEGGLDCIVLKNLDTDSIWTISGVLWPKHCFELFCVSGGWND